MVINPRTFGSGVFCFCALYLHSTGSDVQRLKAVRHSPAPALHWYTAFIIAVRHWTWDLALFCS